MGRPTGLSRIQHSAFSIQHSSFSISSIRSIPGRRDRPPGRNIFQETERFVMAFKKFTASERMLKPDPRLNSKLVSKFINCLMWDGKKTIAQKIFYDAIDHVAQKAKDVPPLEVFATGLHTVKP